MLFAQLPRALGMQGRNEVMLADAHIESVRVRLAGMAEVEVGGNGHRHSLMRLHAIPRKAADHSAVASPGNGVPVRGAPPCPGFGADPSREP